MSGLKEKWQQILYKIRNPETDENERRFKQELNFKRLIILLPFLIAVLTIWLMSLKG